MLTAITALLSSSGIGSILGLFGGYLNRKLDITAKKEDHEFELKKLDKQKEYLELEYKARTEVATIESDAVIESAGYDALGKSYSFAKTTSSDGWVDTFSKVLRPFLTLAFFFLTAYIFYQIHSLISTIPAVFKPEDLIDIYKGILNWIFFQAGVSIGWWFANRPSKGSSNIFKR